MGIRAVESWLWNPGCGNPGFGNPGSGILVSSLGTLWEQSGHSLGDLWETSGRPLGDLWLSLGSSMGESLEAGVAWNGLELATRTPGQPDLKK